MEIEYLDFIEKLAKSNSENLKKINNLTIELNAYKLLFDNFSISNESILKFEEIINNIISSGFNITKNDIEWEWSKVEDAKVEDTKVEYSKVEDTKVECSKGILTIEDSKVDEVEEVSDGEFNLLISKYLTHRDDDTLSSLFVKFPTKHTLIMTKFDTFPDNIDYYIERYNLVEEFDIIKKSKEHIKKNNIIYNDKNTLLDRIIKNIISDSNMRIIHHIREFLILHPFSFNDEYDKIISASNDQTLVLSIIKTKIKLYGKNNILLTEYEKSFYKKGNKISNGDKSNKKFDYKSGNISELVSHLKTVNNVRQRCELAIKNLEKYNRSEYDINIFKIESDFLNYKTVKINDLVLIFKIINQSNNIDAYFELAIKKLKENNRQDDIILFKLELNK